MYYDKGTNHYLGDFAHKTDLYIDEISGTDDYNMSIWALTDAVNDLKGLRDANEDFLSINVDEERAADFGKTDIGGSSHDWAGGDDLVGCNFTAPADVLAESISFYGSYLATPSTYKMAIYNASDLSFIVGTVEGTLLAVPAWHTRALTAATELKQNVEYILCIWSSSSLRIWFDAGDTGQLARDVEAYGAFPDPFSRDNLWAENMSIYVSYSLGPLLQIEECRAGTSYTKNTGYLSYDTWYYLTIARAGTAFTCDIYSSDALRTAAGGGDVDDLEISTLQDIVKYDYAFPVLTSNDGGDNIAYVEVRNYDFQYDYEYVFHGPFDEQSGDRLDGGCNVTVHFEVGTAPLTYLINETETHGFYEKPLYFAFDLIPYRREYWLSEDEDTGNIYIFNQTTTFYTITFIDLTNALGDSSYVSIRRQVNATIHTIEKRKVNQDSRIVAALIMYDQYSIYIEGENADVDYGEIRATADTTIQLTLTGLEFPRNIVEGYKYVRVWAYRNYTDATKCIVNYQDLQESTISVAMKYYFINDTLAAQNTVNSDVFTSTWSGADENTTYYLTVDIVRSIAPTGMSYRQVMPRTFLTSNPFGLDWLWPSAPFDTGVLIPGFILVCCAGIFSALNTRVGLVATVAVAIVLTTLFALPLSEEILMLAFGFAVLLGVAIAKRRLSYG